MDYKTVKKEAPGREKWISSRKPMKPASLRVKPPAGGARSWKTVTKN